MTRAARDAAWPIVLLGLLFSGCSVYDSSLLSAGAGGASGTASGGSDGGGAAGGGNGGNAGVSGSGGATDGGVDADGAAVCQLANPPDPPAQSSADAGAADFAFVTALRALDFGDGSADTDAGLVGAVGYDLDKECTVRDEAFCVDPSWANADHTDGPGGRDNAFGPVLRAISGVLNMTAAPVIDLSSSALNTFVASGAWTLLVRVRGYNGAPDDNHVDVDVYMAGARSVAPAWDGLDAWPVRAASVTGVASADASGPSQSVAGAADANSDADADGDAPTADGSGKADAEAGGSGGAEAGSDGAGALDASTLPPAFTASGYVSQGVVVATFAKLDLRLLVQSSGEGSFALVIPVHDVVLTARLEGGDAGSWQLENGTMAGSIPSKELLTSLVQLPNAFGAGFCTSAENARSYFPLREAVCKCVDFYAGLPSATTNCDAFSFGMGFRAAPATLGSVDLAPDSVRCPQVPQTIADDACDKAPPTP